MRIYIFSTYEEHGANEIEVISDGAKLLDKVESYVRAKCSYATDETIFFAKNRVIRALNHVTEDGEDCVPLVDEWGGPTLDIVEMDK